MHTPCTEALRMRTQIDHDDALTPTQGGRDLTSSTGSHGLPMQPLIDETVAFEVDGASSLVAERVQHHASISAGKARRIGSRRTNPLNPSDPSFLTYIRTTRNARECPRAFTRRVPAGPRASCPDPAGSVSGWPPPRDLRAVAGWPYWITLAEQETTT